MQYLRQSTASQSVLIGPFVDSTDGVTPETGLTIANTDIRLSANGGNMAAKNSGGGTHDEAGWYTITLDATDTATVGRLQLSVAVSGALPVFSEFQVLEEAVFDALFAASAAGYQVPIWSSASATVNLSATTIATASAVTTVNGLASNVITAASIAADAGAEIGRAVWDVDLSSDLTSNLAGTVLYANVYTSVDNLVNDIGANGSGLTALPWNAAWDAEVQSEVTDALNAYDPPTNTEMVAAFTEIKGSTWATTDTLEAIRDRGDAAWTTATGFSTHSAADVWSVATRVLTAATNITAGIADAVWEEAIGDHSATSGSTAEALAAAGGSGDPWVTTLPGSYTGTQAGKILADILVDTGTTLDGKLDTIDGIVDAIVADTNELQTNQGNWLTATGFSTHSAADVRTEIDSNSTQLAAIVADTNELQGDWANGGRLDLILDARSSQTSVDDLPTNAELAAAIITGLTTALTEGYRSTGATGSVRDMLYEIIGHLGEFANTGTTKTVKRLDGSTTAKTYTYDDATTPTSITETT